jgi:hypothetical protein
MLAGIVRVADDADTDTPTIVVATTVIKTAILARFMRFPFRSEWRKLREAWRSPATRRKGCIGTRRESDPEFCHCSSIQVRDDEVILGAPALEVN